MVYSTMGSGITLMDAKGSYSNYQDSNEALTSSLYLTAAGTGAGSSGTAFLSGYLNEISKYDNTLDLSTKVALLQKTAAHLGAAGGSANLWLYGIDLDENGISGSHTALAFNATSGLFALTAAGMLFIAPEALLVMGTLNALSLAFTAMGLMTDNDQTLGSDLERLKGLLDDFFKANPDAYNTLTPAEKARLEAMGFLIYDPNHSRPTFGINDLWNAAQNWAPPRHDPLVLDMDGDGIETVGINAINDVVFDADGDGLKTGTGWVKADDALLVYDRNGNGTIDDGSEFFGDQTMVDGVRATDGFAALSAEDTNNDGVFDASDANYTNVRIWQDKNQDGISQSDELRTLSEAGIASISLTTTTTNKTTNGNTQIANKLNFNNTRRVG